MNHVLVADGIVLDALGSEIIVKLVGLALERRSRRGFLHHLLGADLDARPRGWDAARRRSRHSSIRLGAGAFGELPAASLAAPGRTAIAAFRTMPPGPSAADGANSPMVRAYLPAVVCDSWKGTPIDLAPCLMVAVVGALPPDCCEAWIIRSTVAFGNAHFLR
jgi:hypothetical protein